MAHGWLPHLRHILLPLCPAGDSSDFVLLPPSMLCLAVLLTLSCPGICHQFQRDIYSQSVREYSMAYKIPPLSDFILTLLGEKKPLLGRMERRLIASVIH